MRSIRSHCGHRLHVVAAFIAYVVILNLHMIIASAPGIDPPSFWHFSVVVSDPSTAGTSTQVRLADFFVVEN